MRRTLALLIPTAILLALVACSRHASTAATQPPATASSVPATVTPATTASPEPVTAATPTTVAEPAPTDTALPSTTPLAAILAAGDHMRYLTVDERSRQYLVHVPASVTASERVPVLFAIHGGLGNGALTQQTNAVDPVADREGFIVVYPFGTSRNSPDELLTWNAGDCCGYAQTAQVDDVAYFEALIADLATVLPIDEARLYLTGMSNGGIMSYHLACQMPGVFAAIAPVAGTYHAAENGCAAEAAPLPVLHIHGYEDPHVPYDGGVGPDSIVGVDFESVADSVGYWVAANGCTGEPQNNVDGIVEQQVWADCDGGVSVALYSVVGGGHTWPGHTGWRKRNDPMSTLDGAALVWDFVSQYSLSE